MSLLEWTIWWVLIQILSLFLVVGIPFWFVFRGLKFVKVVFLTWVLFILYSFVFSVVLPGIVYKFSSSIAIKCFPESIVIFPVILLGWIPSIIICLLGTALREFIKNRKYHQHSKSLNK